MTILFVVLLASATADDSRVEPKLVAKIGDQAIHAAEVEAELRRAYGEREFSDTERERLTKAALDQVIDRRLVLGFLSKNGEAASGPDVDLALAQFEKELKAQNLTLAQHCQQVGLSTDDIRRSLAWKLSWKRYAEKYL